MHFPCSGEAWGEFQDTCVSAGQVTPTMVGFIMHKKGKAVVLEKRSKAPVVCSGTGEPSKQEQHNSAIPRAPLRATSPSAFSNVKASGFVYWHSQVEGLDV